MQPTENRSKYKNGKPRIRPSYCTENTDKKYEDMPCDYGWHDSEMFIGIELPKKDRNGKHLKCGSYVKNSKVAGQVKFYLEPMQFRVKPLNVKYAKDINSIELFYPTVIGRDETMTWEIWDEVTPLNDWMNKFPKVKKKENE